ncbi:hypothetical protein HS088_TW11G00393 [Tripterygium wilfordii]|uniref:Uncharacterized protein n=1 Tax=Tripterygium wilfordii TaxID=458696 RepID=A0A7J7D2N3_TRIWF|nr:hypothetical protein HS088_TW11G00393 [Tripterygium wilfordii]
MSALQRSAVSFRRQGSSGRIWDVTDPKTGRPLGVSPHDKSGELFLQQIENQKAKGKVVDASNSPDSPPPFKPENTDSSPENKTQRCGLSSIFRRCIGPSTTQ